MRRLYSYRFNRNSAAGQIIAVSNNRCPKSFYY